MFALATRLVSSEVNTLFNLTSSQQELFHGVVDLLGFRFGLPQQQSLYLSVDFIATSFREGVFVADSDASLTEFYKGVKYMNYFANMSSLLEMNSMSESTLLGLDLLGVFTMFYSLNQTEQATVLQLNQSEMASLEAKTYYDVNNLGAVVNSSTVHMLVRWQLAHGEEYFILLSIALSICAILNNALILFQRLNPFLLLDPRPLVGKGPLR